MVKICSYFLSIATAFCLISSLPVMLGSHVAYAQKSASDSKVPIPARKPKREDVVKSIEVAKAPPKDIALTKKARSYAVKGVFSDRQARLAREIFDLQSKGLFVQADERRVNLKTDILEGHILAERYLHAAYKSTFSELSSWMYQYDDHPQAKRIYELALKRKPARVDLVEPQNRRVISGNLANVGKNGQTYRSSKRRSKSEQARVQKLRRNITRHIERYEPTLAMTVLANDYSVQFMDNVEYDRLQAKISAGHLYAGKLDKALKLATTALNRSGEAVPEAGWIKGLVQWQRSNYASAAKGFEVAATSPYASGWMISAASYWASRAHMRNENTDVVAKWLDNAAAYPRTFYGLIAMRAMGKKSVFDWSMPSLSREHIKYVESTPVGRRVSALIKAGRHDLAEEELKIFPVKDSESHKQALIAYAYYNNLPALSIKLANAFSRQKGGLYDAALYPLPDWKPKEGYYIDRALVYAIARQESRFHVNAQNPSGATGLMQLMPKTAAYIAGDDLKFTQADLSRPEINLELGQRYIKKLLTHKYVSQDILSMAMAYNAGPGNLSKWKSERQHIKDPLLFIETIPYRETRAFVERVMANYWIYRLRLNQDTPSLDDVAKGRWARYESQDRQVAQVAMGQ